LAADRAPDRGFTLIEVLVALALFSLAALTLLRLEGATMTNARMLEVRAAAGIVARNRAVEALTDPTAPAIGTVSGSEVQAGRPWPWVRVTTPMPDAGLVQVAIHVASPFGGEAAAITVYRRTP
jgi:general secretion pathway protein I